MCENVDKICIILDKLTMEALSLLEEEIETKLNIENAMCDGETHLAKSRYILGQNQVSSLQLPTADSPEFSASAVINLVESSGDFNNLKTVDLELKKKNEVCHENDDKTIDPIKWFGVLVPQDLVKAQAKFKQALRWVVQGVNVQSKLIETCNKIEELKKLKCSN